MSTTTWTDITPNVSARSADGRFAVRICHLNAGWRWLAYDHQTDPRGGHFGDYASKEEAQAVCEARRDVEQSWEMTPEAAERNAKFAAFANSAQGRAQERVCIKRALRAAGVEIPARILGDAAALRELADARGVTPYTWEQVKARNAHFAAVAALREVRS